MYSLQASTTSVPTHVDEKGRPRRAFALRICSNTYSLVSSLALFFRSILSRSSWDLLRHLVHSLPCCHFLNGMFALHLLQIRRFNAFWIFSKSLNLADKNRLSLFTRFKYPPKSLSLLRRFSSSGGNFGCNPKRSFLLRILRRARSSSRLFLSSDQSLFCSALFLCVQVRQTSLGVPLTSFGMIRRRCQ